ncbi:hypothetical protein SAMN06265367_102187 [Algoriphagus winogradskyi]|uniref:Tissue inhibitor of metalloproteinase n=2 Tax=Algoriphagus winogradskyi TaxID=237017 RepID=A0ABY1NM42_9BACT|nr:hypothetical protein SAMN06265367_102187 [Algoriphagus winogradskyi]
MTEKIQQTENHQYHFVSYLKRIMLILFLLSLPTIGWTCTCMSLTKKNVKKITKNADYVLLGTAVENVHHNDSIKATLDSEKFGIDVKFKVEKVYKGSLQAEFVYINQFETDNCIQAFRFGEKYIIVGTRIEKFENLRPFSEAVYKEDKIFETVASPPPPPIGGLTIRKMKCYNIEMELVEHWNKIAENEIVVYTNQCSSFNAESTYGKYFSK